MIDSGTVLQGRFLIEDRIGVGGMGAVYRAVDQKFGSLVAIKETFYGDTNLAEAFEREARLLNGLHHAILPHVSDYFTENGGHFLVMEFIEGEDLSEILKRGEIFPVSTVLKWALDLLDGLDYLHSQNPPVVHRDIKPNNLKVTSWGKIMLLDFGMAKETSGNTLGAQSVFGYSRRYSPLEQIEGTGTDQRSDIFSLGATIYHLITGKAAVDVLARASAIVAGRPDPLLPANAINPEVSEEVAAILTSALSLNAEHRFESARAMSNALEYVINSSAAEHARGHDNLAPLASAAAAAAAPPVKAVAVPVNFEALETEEEINITEPVLTDSDEISTGATAAAGFFSEGGNSVYSPTPSVSGMRIVRPSRPSHAVWLPVLLACLALVLYGGYRGLTGGDDAADTADVVATENTSPVNPEASTSESSEVREGVRENDTRVSSEKNGDAVVQRKNSTPTSANARNETVDAESALADDEIDEDVVAAPARRSDRRTQTQRAAQRPASRVMRPAFEQPSVSSIEMIMTGIPSDRRPRADQRDEWTEEELREQRRLRRLRRNSRPF